MSQLIPFSSRLINGATVPTVNGRHIHEHLGIAKAYATWVKTQIKRGYFVENKDYIVYSLEGKNPDGGRPSSEYHFTLRAAEHIGMMSQTPKGEEVRDYFLSCEQTMLERSSSAIDQFPELKAIVELAQSTAEARVAAEEARLKAHEAEIRAVRAETKADMALDEAHRMTIEEFITKNGLLGKWPYSEHKQIAGWLRKFCESYGLPTWKVAVYGKPWKDEIAYPLQACAAWLRMALHAPRQLQIVPSVPVTDTVSPSPVPGIEVR